MKNEKHRDKGKIPCLYVFSFLKRRLNIYEITGICNSDIFTYS